VLVKTLLQGVKKQHGNQGNNGDGANDMGNKNAEIDGADDAIATKFRQSRIGVIIEINNQKQHGQGDGRFHAEFVSSPIPTLDKVKTADQDRDGQGVYGRQNMGKGGDVDHQGKLNTGMRFQHDAAVHEGGDGKQQDEEDPLVDFRFFRHQ